MCFLKNELKDNYLLQKRLKREGCDRPRFVG